MIAIVASMEREVSRLRRHAGPVPVRITGVGKHRAEAGVYALLQGPDRPDAILSLGFAGALKEELSTGDLVICRRHFVPGEECTVEPDPGMIELALEALTRLESSRHHVADSVTLPDVVCGVREKADLSASTGAWVANMEDFWIGRLASEEGIPFLSVRAVLDTARQELPPFVAELGGKGLPTQVLHTIAHGIRRPGHLARIVKLSRQARVAQGSLAAFGVLFSAGSTGATSPTGTAAERSTVGA